jgi:hypothetical protein
VFFLLAIVPPTHLKVRETMKFERLKENDIKWCHSHSPTGSCVGSSYLVYYSILKKRKKRIKEGLLSIFTTEKSFQSRAIALKEIKYYIRQNMVDPI